MYILERDLGIADWEFKQRKYLDYQIKIQLTINRIYEWYNHWQGKVHLSFSGGLDSTVLLHIIRTEFGDSIPAVFCNTGLEFPEIVSFAGKACGSVIEIKPKRSYRSVILKEGYPLISKETAAKIRKLRKGNLSDRYRNYLLNGDERGKFGMLPKKWRFLVNAPFDISEKCCDIMKKHPFKLYQRETGQMPFVAITQDESFRREHQYEKTGCNVFDVDYPKSQPLAFWTKQDILRYVVENDLEICSVYGDIIKLPDGTYVLTGEQRTGCIFCAFGAHLEQCPNRFQRLEETHTKLHNYCMKPIDEGGLGMAKVLEFANIPYRNNQLKITMDQANKAS